MTYLSGGGGGGAGVTWPLTNTGDETFQPNSVTNSVLTLHNNASAVNLLTITGTATTVDPSLAASGSDTNVALALKSQGTGDIYLLPGSASGTVSLGDTQQGSRGTSSIRVLTSAGGTFAVFNAVAGRACLSVTAVASLANGVTLTGAVTTAAPKLAATGPDTNIDLILNSKGTGLVNIGPASAAVAISGAAAPATLAVTTGGATGPATATQNQWLAVKVNGTVNYIPTWV